MWSLRGCGQELLYIYYIVARYVKLDVSVVIGIREPCLLQTVTSVYVVCLVGTSDMPLANATQRVTLSTSDLTKQKIKTVTMMGYKIK